MSVTLKQNSVRIQVAIKLADVLYDVLDENKHCQSNLFKMEDVLYDIGTLKSKLVDIFTAVTWSERKE